jgi:hypothetical protein
MYMPTGPLVQWMQQPHRTGTYLPTAIINNIKKTIRTSAINYHFLITPKIPRGFSTHSVRLRPPFKEAGEVWPEARRRGLAAHWAGSKVGGHRSEELEPGDWGHHTLEEREVEITSEEGLDRFPDSSPHQN